MKMLSICLRKLHITVGTQHFPCPFYFLQNNFDSLIWKKAENDKLVISFSQKHTELLGTVRNDEWVTKQAEEAASLV